MINNIQNTFSIQDLEILSGIKAHTIRIWEKRYGVLNPMRLNRNIRIYTLLDLKKILNVSLLLKYNYKISQLSKLADGELENKAKLVSLEDLNSNYHINSLIVSMFSYNSNLFEDVYLEQIKTLNFNQIFLETYVPLLKHIGILWQTNGLQPAQEHFISNLINQKIALHTALIDRPQTTSKRVNVLFLPKGEIHELGLLYLSYHLKLLGEKTVYLGTDIPTDNLFNINSQFQEINWICSFLLGRTDDEKNQFITEMANLLNHTKNTATVIGEIWRDYSTANVPKNLTFNEQFGQLINNSNEQLEAMSSE